MPLKEKVIGLIIVIFGALPFLTNIPQITGAIEKYAFLKTIVPGSLPYQIIIIALGISLIWTLKPQVRVRARR